MGAAKLGLRFPTLRVGLPIANDFGPGAPSGPEGYVRGIRLYGFARAEGRAVALCQAYEAAHGSISQGDDLRVIADGMIRDGEPLTIERMHEIVVEARS